MKAFFRILSGLFIINGKHNIVKYSGHDLISGFRLRNFSSNSLSFKHGKQDAKPSALIVVFSACVE